MREIEDILDIEPTDEVAKAKQALSTVKGNLEMVFDDKPDERFNEDFEEVRTSLKDLISEVSDVVQKLSIIAQDSEKAAHFSALAQLTMTLLNSNKQLIELYDAKKKYYTPTQFQIKEKNSTTIQNAIFTGTTSDLADWIEKMQQAKSKTIDH